VCVCVCVCVFAVRMAGLSKEMSVLVCDYECYDVFYIISYRAIVSSLTKNFNDRFV
jgi:hypothetical protein